MGTGCRDDVPSGHRTVTSLTAAGMARVEVDCDPYPPPPLTSLIHGRPSARVAVTLVPTALAPPPRGRSPSLRTPAACKAGATATRAAASFTVIKSVWPSNKTAARTSPRHESPHVRDRR